MKTLSVSIMMLVFLCMPVCAAAQEEKVEETSLEKMGIGEIVEELKANLENYPEMLGFIPELRMEQDDKGVLLYTYADVDGFIKTLEELSEDVLLKLYKRIASEANRLYTDRILRQLEQVRMPSGIPSMPQQIASPPEIPQAPPMPSDIPSIPVVPAARKD